MIAQSETIATEVVKNIHWQELGIAGVVIAALFGVIWFLLKQASEERKDTRDCHREERSEWREHHKEHSERLEKAVDKLADAVRDLSK